MTARNAFRGPGYWNTDLGLSKRIPLRRALRRAAAVRGVQRVQSPEHVRADTDNAEVSVGEITGYKDGNRRIQLGAKFEF
jgi:hypothetical protein